MFDFIMQIAQPKPKTPVKPCYEYPCDCGGTAIASNYVTELANGSASDWEGVCFECETWGMHVPGAK